MGSEWLIDFGIWLALIFTGLVIGMRRHWHKLRVTQTDQENTVLQRLASQDETIAQLTTINTDYQHKIARQTEDFHRDLNRQFELLGQALNHNEKLQEQNTVLQADTIQTKTANALLTEKLAHYEQELEALREEVKALREELATVQKAKAKADREALINEGKHKGALEVIERLGFKQTVEMLTRLMINPDDDPPPTEPKTLTLNPKAA